MRLRWDDRIGGPRPVPESQERSKIRLGRKKVRSPLDARAVRIFESDAVRSSISDGKGFGRRSASGRLYCRRWHLGLGQLLGSDAGRVLTVAYCGIDGHRLAVDRVVNPDFYAVLHPQDLRREDQKESALAQAFSIPLKGRRCTCYVPSPFYSFRCEANAG
jgi:hypothetical protein